MNIRFYNGHLLTMANGMEITGDEVWVQDDKISYVGTAREDMPKFDREIDLKGNLLMPGFKNAHTHSAMTFARSLADDMPLQPWLFDKIFPMEEKLTPERVYMLNKLAVMEYVSSGVTASFDMYFFRDHFAQSNIDTGFRSVICGVGGTYEEMDDEYIKYNKINPLISYIPGFHAEYTNSLEGMKAVAALARNYKAPVYTHNSETESETRECIERHGMTPTALFESLGMFEYGGGGYHCVWFNDEDIEIFARRGASVVTNPCSNAKLASGIAPLTKMMEKGVNIAIGTDGPSSNNALDFFREMYLMTVLQKLKNNDAAACDADLVLKAATVGGAKAMFLHDCDVIAEGKQADMIVIDMHRPNMQPVNNLTKNIVYSGSKENVKLTMIAGKILYENGEFYIGEEPEKVYAESNRIVKEMLAEM